MASVGDLGTDIKSDWNFTNGDLNIVTGMDNLDQAISNRLSTDYGTSLFYDEYGSLLRSYLGWRASESTLEFIRLEIGNRLMQDPRLREYGVAVEYMGDGVLRVDIRVVLLDDLDYGVSLVISDSGVEIDGSE